MLARHHAAVAVAVGPEWRGRAVLLELPGRPATHAAARAQLAERYPNAQRIVLRAQRSLGFARAVNLALDACAGDYVAVMNADGTPAPDMLVLLVQALDPRPDAVWAAPAVYGPEEPRHPPGPPRPEAELAGTALLIRRVAFLAAGGFDPAYVVYNEDYDASRRLRAAGHVLLRVPAARFHHGKEERTALGALRREWHYARTAPLLALQYAASLPAALADVARRRARSLADHARARRWPELTGIALATPWLPRAVLTAVARRRRPWNGARLEAWLEGTRAQVTACRRPSAPRTQLPAAGAGAR